MRVGNRSDFTKECLAMPIKTGSGRRQAAEIRGGKFFCGKYEKILMRGADDYFDARILNNGNNRIHPSYRREAELAQGIVYKV